MSIINNDTIKFINELGFDVKEVISSTVFSPYFNDKVQHNISEYVYNYNNYMRDCEITNILPDLKLSYQLKYSDIIIGLEVSKKSNHNLILVKIKYVSGIYIFMYILSKIYIIGYNINIDKVITIYEDNIEQY